MSKFDAATSLLREFLGVRTLNGNPFDGSSLVPALRVLEAAAKVDKRDLDIALRPGVTAEKSWAIERLKAVLASLPDKEPR